MCPELHPAISVKGEWLKCDSCGHVAFYEDTFSMCKGCHGRTACRMDWPSDEEIVRALSQNHPEPSRISRPIPPNENPESKRTCNGGIWSRCIRLFDNFMSMTQDQINVGLFDEVKKLQNIKRRHEADEHRMAHEIERLRVALHAATAQLEHVEDLRRMDCGPIPATFTPVVIAAAKRLLPNDEMTSPHNERK